MYEIKVDGQVFYSPALSDVENQIIAPRLKCEFNKTDSFSFTLPPGHAMKSAISRMKSIITVTANGTEIFRGRVLEDKQDYFNQLEVQCEGEMSFLLDSLQRPYKFKGTTTEFLQMVLEKHNQQVSADKHFSLGVVSAAFDKRKFSSDNIDYKNTLADIRSVLIGRYTGFLRVRYADGVRYLDFLEKYNETSGQKIEFGVNLLDIEKHTNAQEIFTVLVPLGKYEGNSRLTIKSVNNGLDYIEDAEGIAKYGRITKEYVWDDIEDPQQLLDLARTKMNEAASIDTLTIKAIDLHLLYANADNISLGDSVHILSAPHGFDKELVCSAIDFDLFNPENTTYTFGKVEYSMTDNVAANKRTSHQCHVDLRKTHSEYIELEGQVEQFYSSFSEVEIKLNAVTTTINLKADKTEMTAISQRVTSAEVAIDGANAEIALRVRENEVISAINLTPEEARIKASKIVLDGYVTTSALQAEIAGIKNTVSTSVVTSSLSAHNVSCSVLEVTDAVFKPTLFKYMDQSGNAASAWILAMD